MFLHDAIYRVRRRLALWSAIGILSAAIATITSLQANRRPNGLEVVLYVISLIAAAFAYGNYHQKCQLDSQPARLQSLRRQEVSPGKDVINIR